MSRPQSALDRGYARAAQQERRLHETCTMCDSPPMPGRKMCLPCAEECGGHGV